MLTFFPEPDGFVCVFVWTTDRPTLPTFFVLVLPKLLLLLYFYFNPTKLRTSTLRIRACVVDRVREMCPDE